MKRPNRRLPIGEKGSLILAASVTGALLLLALLLPLAFRTSTIPASEESDVLFSVEQRSRLFAAWWTGAEDEKPRSEKLSEPGEETIEFCRKRMRALVELCVPDQGLEETEPTGSDYTRVIGDGGAIRVCRMWLEAQGDWQNWMDVCFDADTGDIYYLYVSRSCLRNADRYRSDEPLTAARVAERLAKELDGTLRHFEPTENGAVALISAEGGTVIYGLKCVNYDRLIDVKVQCA